MEAGGEKEMVVQPKGKGLNKGKVGKVFVPPKVVQLGQKTMTKTNISDLISVTLPKSSQLMKRNAKFELKFSSSAIFVSDAVAGNLLDFLGTKQYGRFACVTSDLWESELPWRMILISLNQHLLQDMLANHLPKDPHPRCMVQFCLGLGMLCVGCEAKLWEGYFKMAKPLTLYYYDSGPGQRVCKECHVEAFADCGQNRRNRLFATAEISKDSRRTLKESMPSACTTCTPRISMPTRSSLQRLAAIDCQ